MSYCLRFLLNAAKGLDNLGKVKKARQQPLYEESKGCEKRWSMLRFMLDLLILKAKHCWSDASFNDLLLKFSDVLPKPNNVPTNTYQAKKIVTPLTMGVERIHACPNHCILYHGVFKDLMNYPSCGASCYKRNASFVADNVKKGRKVGKKRMANGKTAKPADHQEHSSNLARDDSNQRRVPALVMWYLSPIDRLRHIFSNTRDS